MFIPAHIWTPHFSLFGAFSGFDTIEECFEDLTPHIHALGNGPFLRPADELARVRCWTGITLVSNSDAHSPAKAGAGGEPAGAAACPTRALVRRHPNTARGSAAPLNSFPEEGKYHLDGHRNCGVCLTPAETDAAAAALCPVCGKKLTIGVEHRVEELADRPEGLFAPKGAKPL